jgi:hypothetical protein
MDEISEILRKKCRLAGVRREQLELASYLDEVAKVPVIKVRIRLADFLARHERVNSGLHGGRARL